jgi:pyridine nucleotide-disulfide oxidoreductase domain-containing protein 1
LLFENFISIRLKESRNIEIEYSCEVKKIIEPDEISKFVLNKNQLESFEREKWPVYVQLTNDKIYGCDFIISATGVLPSIGPFIQNNRVILI